MPGRSEGDEVYQSAKNYRLRILSFCIRQLLQRDIGNIRITIAGFQKRFQTLIGFVIERVCDGNTLGRR